jgi:hypothetical protein
VAHYIPIKEDFRVVDFKSVKSGKIEIEVIPIDETGRPISNQILRNPAAELANKKFNFILKINQTTRISSVFEVNFKYFFLYRK